MINEEFTMARIGCCSVIVSLVVMLVGCASYKERAYELAFQCEERNPPLKKWREDAVPDVEDNETRWNFREEEGRSRADGVSSSLIAFSGKKVTVECCDDDNIVIRDAGSGNVLAEHPSGFSHFLQCAACLDKRQQQFLLVVKGIRPYYAWSTIHVFDKDFDCVWEYRIPGRGWMVVDNGDSVTFCHRYNNHRVEVNFWPGFVDEKSLESNKH